MNGTSPLAPNLRPSPAHPEGSTFPAWAHRRDVAITLFLWGVLAAAAFWAASYVVGPLLIVVLAALLAYAVGPFVRLLAQRIPLALAIALVYLALVGLVSGVGYLLVSNAVTELSSLATQITHLLTPGSPGAPTPLTQHLERLGLSQTQVQDLSQRAIQQLQNAAQNALPLLGGVVNGLATALLDVVLVLVLSIYFLVAWPRFLEWLTQSAPVRQRGRLAFVLVTLQRVIGGYLRGQLILSTLVGALVGGGMYLLHVPYALLLGVLAFLLEFIPMLGTLTSGVICILVALTQGWPIALLVLGYFVAIHILEGYVVAPRVLAKAVGLHPAISIIALLVGAQILGIWGALFAAPLVGFVQVLFAAAWVEWRHDHLSQFADKVVKADKMGIAPAPRAPAMPDRTADNLAPTTD
ncbi:MAG TPA: AI-2E family transporter [Ktedonobacterales bacterium]|nr:AI-2E family transporter [Ktedonobacterales bacterium]